MTTVLPWVIVAALLGAAAWWFVRRHGGRKLPDALRVGRSLPDLPSRDETGESRRFPDLQGAPSVVLFVRGNWCPFCTSQVADLTRYYKDIVDTGARLIFVTPRPLETTRRVAEFYDVDFEFWLDEDLAITTAVGLKQEDGVPADFQREYGHDTTWPAALVMDADGVIRFSEISQAISDRPDPEKLLAEIRKLVDA